MGSVMAEFCYACIVHSEYVCPGFCAAVSVRGLSIQEFVGVGFNSFFEIRVGGSKHTIFLQNPKF